MFHVHRYVPFSAKPMQLVKGGGELTLITKRCQCSKIAQERIDGRFTLEELYPELKEER